MTLLIISFISSIKTLSFKYPTAFSLKNGNIFVIHSLGIDICDSDYTTNTNIIKFSNALLETDLQRMSMSKYSNGEFIIFIIDKLYLFNENGENLFTGSHRFGYESIYTLSAQKIDQENGHDYYYYLFGFISTSENDLNLYYCKLDLTDSKIDCPIYKILYKLNIKTLGLSCQIITNQEIDYIMFFYKY